MEGLLSGKGESCRSISNIDNEDGANDAAIIVLHGTTQVHQSSMLLQILQVRRPGLLPELATCG